MSTRDPRVNAYIAKSQDFAKPILTHIRDLVHSVCPDVEERIQWGAPHFYYKGQTLCGMAGFKEHAALNFWQASRIEGLGPGSGGASAGSVGKLTSRRDLPSRAVMAGYIWAAMKLNDDGVTVKRPKSAPKPEAKVPRELAAALAQNKKAKAALENFPPGQRREYCEWIDEAKREETKAERVTQAVEWMEEGKSRNWQYRK
jgi:uncharacterized protein YdeI (YjbR/CyaY-like superfamily)